MLEFQYENYKVKVADDHIEIYLDNDLRLTYSDRYGETIYGVNSPLRIVELKEVLSHVRSEAHREQV
jgi:hypothetical protein